MKNIWNREFKYKIDTVLNGYSCSFEFIHDRYVAALNKDVHDPNKLMTIPMIGLAAASIVIGVYPAPLVRLFEMVAGGLF